MQVPPRIRARLRPARQALRRARRPARWGNLRRQQPFSANMGFARGTPVDRHHIEAFLAEHRADIRGDVLEVAHATYTRRFGDPAARSHVVDRNRANPEVTIRGDLATPGVLGRERFDCIVLTQTLQYLESPERGLTAIWGALRPGGVALLSLPSISAVDQDSVGELWRFTPEGARRLLERTMPGGEILLRAAGNLVAATAFLHGLAAQDLRARDLADHDARFPVVVLARVRKPAPGADPTGQPPQP